MAKRLLLLNGVAILCVIVFHAAGFGFTAMFSWPHRYRAVTSPNYDAAGTTSYYALRLVEQLVAFAIPAFLFVSGYFVSVVAGRSQTPVRARAMSARIRNLLVPYLFWSVVILAAFALQGRVFSNSRYVAMLLTGSSNPSYYYVPLLVQMYLLAPLIVILARRHWKALLAATGALQVLVYLLQYSLVLDVQDPLTAHAAAWFPKWFGAVYVFWFASGVVTGFHAEELKPRLQRARWILLASAACLFAVGVVEWEVLLALSGSPWREIRLTLVDGLYAATTILSFLAFSEVRIPYSTMLSKLGAKSYGIYLVHGLVMEYFSRSVYHLAPWLLGRQALFQPLVIAAGLLVPLAMMDLVSRSPARRLHAYLFG